LSHALKDALSNHPCLRLAWVDAAIASSARTELCTSAADRPSSHWPSHLRESRRSRSWPPAGRAQRSRVTHGALPVGRGRTRWPRSQLHERRQLHRQGSVARWTASPLLVLSDRASPTAGGQRPVGHRAERKDCKSREPRRASSCSLDAQPSGRQRDSRRSEHRRSDVPRVALRFCQSYRAALYDNLRVLDPQVMSRFRRVWYLPICRDFVKLRRVARGQICLFWYPFGTRFGSAPTVACPGADGPPADSLRDGKYVPCEPRGLAIVTVDVPRKAEAASRHVVHQVRE